VASGVASSSSSSSPSMGMALRRVDGGAGGVAVEVLVDDRYCCTTAKSFLAVLKVHVVRSFQSLQKSVLIDNNCMLLFKLIEFQGRRVNFYALAQFEKNYYSPGIFHFANCFIHFSKNQNYRKKF
jgi:hypothetical protein